MVFAVNVTFCESQYKMADCVLSALESANTGTDCVQPTVGDDNCVGTWPDRKNEPITAADQTKKGPTFGMDYKDGGIIEVDGKKVSNPYTTMSHTVASVGASMTVTSGSCFIWNSYLDTSFYAGKDIGNFPLSARAWCGGNGDKPTVQFYKGGNCAEDTELGGKNNKDDKGLIFNAADTCEDSMNADTAVDKDGPFAALGAFSCVEVVDSMNEVDICAEKDNKDLKGFAQKTVPALFTLASKTCLSKAGGGLGGEYGFVNEGGRTMLSNAVCFDQCADMPSPITEMAKDPAGCPAASKADPTCSGYTCAVTVTDKQCTKVAPVKHSIVECRDDSADATGDDKPTEKPSTGASCRTASLGEDVCIADGTATKEEVDKKGDGDCNKAYQNPNQPCSFKNCFSYIMAPSCESIPTFFGMGLRVKTMEDLKDDLPARPLNPMLFVIAGAAVVVIILLICFIRCYCYGHYCCQPCCCKKAPTDLVQTDGDKK